MKAHGAESSKGVTRWPIDEVVGSRLRKIAWLSEDRREVGLREYEPRLCNLLVETLVLRSRRSK